MPTVLSKIIQSYELWFRLGTFIHEPLKTALRNILHNVNNDSTYQGLPTDPGQLYQVLDQRYRQRLNNYRTQKLLQADQMAMLFPANKQTHSEKFDITLIVFLIRVCTNFLPPLTGWNPNNLLATDNSVVANVLRGEALRNYFHNTNPDELDEQTFEEKWNEGCAIVLGLRYHYDTTSLRTACLDPMRFSILQSCMAFLQKEQEKLKEIVNNNKIDVESNFKKLEKNLKDLRASESNNTLIMNTKIDNLVAALNLLKHDVNNCLSMQNEFRGVVKNSKQIVLFAVLNIVCKEIFNDWKKLAYNLGISQTKISRVEQSFTSSYDKMMNCFELLKNNIIWQDLKTELKKLDRMDLIEKIKNNTLITIGIRDSYLTLKRMHTTDLINWLILAWDGQTYETIRREDAYVELAVIDAKEIDRDWNGTYKDQEFYMKTRHFERTSIHIKQILTHNDKFVIVRGIAGIGKSTMVETYAFKWANGEILNGNESQPKIDFLFFLKCREINTFPFVENAMDILAQQYSHVLNGIEFKDLEEISHRVLILVDGIDEMQSIHTLNETNNNQLPPSLSSLCELLNTQSKTFLAGHYTVVAGRPEACQKIKEHFNGKIEMKLVEICGFSPASINVFIEKHFKAKPDMITVVKKRIEESENLHVMSSIPVYTWVICGLFDELVNFDSPTTTTHLCSYACLLFLRKHLRILPKLGLGESSLLDLIANDTVCKIILCLAQLSESSLNEKKVVFSHQEIRAFDIPIDLEKTGFFVKSSPISKKKILYQFRHLVLQEYLAALFLFLQSSNITETLKLPSLSSCMPIVAGLSGIFVSKNNDPIADMIRNLQTYMHGDLKFKVKLFFRPGYEKKVRSIPHAIQTDIEQMLMRQVDENRLIIDERCSAVLSAHFEFQQALSDSCVDQLSGKIVHINNLTLHHDIRNAMYLLDKLQSITVDSISINNLRNSKLPENLRNIFYKFYEKRTVKKLEIEGGNEMKISTKRYILHIKIIENEADGEITETNPNEKHSDLLRSAFLVAGEITLQYSLKKEYLLIKDIINSACVQDKVFYEKLRGKIYSVSQMSMRMDAFVAEGSDILKLDKAGLTHSHIIVMQPFLNHVRILDLSKNGDMSPESLQLISDTIILNNMRLDELKLVACDLVFDHIQYLSPCISYIDSLDISSNYELNGDSMDMISNAVIFGGESNLKKLTLTGFFLTDHHIEQLSPCINLLTHLDISYNDKLSPSAMQLISDTIISAGENINLQTIDLCQCSMTEEHMLRLTPCVERLRFTF